MKEASAIFFNLINSLHEKVSLIISTKKSPTECAEILDDEGLANALPDRLLYKCEVIKLSEASYRMENRQTILKKETRRGRPRNNPEMEGTQGINFAKEQGKGYCILHSLDLETRLLHHAGLSNS